MKKFYKTVDLDEKTDGYGILLDGRPVRTPLRLFLVAPSRPLAEKIKEEWLAQGEEIKPDTMPFMQILSTALDKTSSQRDQMVKEVLAYVQMELICYYALEPDDLVEQERERWRHIANLLQDKYGLTYKNTEGFNHVDQPKETINKMESLIADMDVYEFTLFQITMALLGSAAIAFAFVKKHIDTKQAFEAALVDEIYQANRWGEDDEVKEKWQSIQLELDNILLFLNLLN